MAVSLVSAALMATASPAAITAAPAVPPAVQVVAGPEEEQAGAADEEAGVAEVQPAPEEQLPPVIEPVAPPDAGPQVTPDDEPVIIVSAASQGRLIDPLVRVNEAAFEVTQEIDTALVAPLAEAYEEDLPSPVRNGLRNFLRNLMEPITALNYLLQLNPGKAFETLGRFAINSTVGVAGLFDVAKKEPFNLPYRRNGFGNTMGYYGVGPGPFLVLPLIGATSLRDLLGSTLDQSVLPLAVGSPFNTPYYAIPAYTVNSLEFRIEFDERLEQINTSDDPYFAMRESYLCLREADIAALKNRPPPRDCSIAALMALPEAVAGPIPLGPNAAEAVTAASEEPASEAEMTPPAPPEIIYISEEVVQPLPEA